MRRYGSGAWFAFVAGGLLTVAAGCGGGRGATGPSEAPTVQGAILAPLQGPDRLRPVWGAIDTAPGPVARFGANAVALQIGVWGEDTTRFAAWARERSIVVLPFVEQVFAAPRGNWGEGWSRVETWAKPLATAGVLVGWHVSDEWAYRGAPQGMRDEAVAYVRGRSSGLEVLNTEWVDTVLHRDYRRPQGRWF